MARLMRVSGILLLGFLLTNCSRSLDETSSLQFDLSSLQNGSLSAGTTEVDFVAINVSGPGMDRVICRYDDIEDVRRWVGPCNGDPGNPLQVAIPNVPAGDGRLIQVMGILKDSDNEDSETFSYGEVLQGLVAGDNPVNVVLQSAPAVTNMEGSATGRYLFGDGTAYTGKVALEFLPPTGSAPMEIFHLEMFAGWFQIYLLDNIDLQYRMLDPDFDNHLLFGGVVNQGSSVFNPNNPSVINISSPRTYYDDGDSDSGEFVAFGFWTGGAPDGTSSVCYDNTTTYAEYDYTDAAGTNTLTFPADFTIAGGSGTCAMSTTPITASNMRFNGDLLMADGGDEILFRGPYAMMISGGGEPDFASAYASGNQVTVNWQYLPGVASSADFGGTAIFHSNTFDGDLSREFEGGGGFYCRGLLDRGFQVVEVPATQQTATFTTTGEYANKGVVILCPMDAEGNYMSSATGTGVFPAPAVSLEIAGADRVVHPYLNDNSCTALEINGLDANGYPGSLPGAGETHYTVSLSAANGSFYEDPFCLTGTNTLAMNYSGEKIWYKVNLTPPQTVNPSVASHPIETDVLTSYTWSGLSTTVTSPAAYGFEIDTADELFGTTECFPVLVSHVDVNGVPLNAGAVTVNMNSTQGYDIHAYWDDSCSSGPDNVADLSSGKSYAFFWVAPVTNGAELTETLYTSHTRDAGSVNDDSFDIDFKRPPNATYMRVEKWGPYYGTNTCHTMYITTYINGDGQQSPKSYPGQQKRYDFSTTGPGTMTFYTNGTDCSGGTNPVTQFDQLTSQYEVPVYFKVTADGTYNLSVQEINAGGEFNFSSNVDVQP